MKTQPDTRRRRWFMKTFHPSKLRTQGWRVMYRSGNDRPQHVHFDFEPISIYDKTSFNHGSRWQARNLSRIWAEQDLGWARFGPSRIWTEQDLGQAGFGLSRIWAEVVSSFLKGRDLISSGNIGISCWYFATLTRFPTNQVSRRPI